MHAQEYLESFGDRLRSEDRGGDRASRSLSQPRRRSAATRPGRVDRKALQLCRQVEHTLGDVLAGDCDDEILRGLAVLAVQPAPDASRLMVTVAPGVASRPWPVEEVMIRLQQVAGRLRAEVASSITRRKTPTLVYQVLPGSALQREPIG
jgi:ribosome-binding factor A